jgi:hypothetical protein
MGALVGRDQTMAYVVEIPVDSKLLAKPAGADPDA